MPIALLLHNIRSAHNVGSIFRIADAVSVSQIYLTGYTPTPIDRFGRTQKEIAKTALGAEKSISWRYAKTPKSFIKQLKKEGWRIVGVEQDVRARDYRMLTRDYPTLFIFGNEVRGISRELRAECDDLIEIPMRGVMVQQSQHPHHSGNGKESLNVAVSAGIILFQTLNK